MQKAVIVLLFLFSYPMASYGQAKFMLEARGGLNFVAGNIPDMPTGNRWGFAAGSTGGTVPTYLLFRVEEWQNVTHVDSIMKNIFVGGLEVGIRPFANKWFSRFQPFIQAGWMINTIKSDSSYDTVQQFKFKHFVSLAAGAEFYLTNCTSLCVTVQEEAYDYRLSNSAISCMASFRFVVRGGNAKKRTSKHR